MLFYDAAVAIPWL